MSTAKSKSTASKTLTKLEICSAFEKVLPVGDSCVLNTDSMVVIAFHLRDEGERKIVTGKDQVKHDITEYAKSVTWRGIQRVVDGQMIDIGTPKGGLLRLAMSEYHGQA